MAFRQLLGLAALIAAIFAAMAGLLWVSDRVLGAVSAVHWWG